MDKAEQGGAAARLPDLAELLALRGAAQALSLRGRGPARAPLQGGHRSAHRGRGLEFQEVRPYEAGDDPPTIDWRVTARRGRPHTKLFREERERAVWLLADLDAALFFGTRRQLKSALLVRAAALLAWTAALGGDRVGAVIAAPAEARILAPRPREAGVLPLLSALAEMQPASPGAAEPENLNGALRTLSPLVQPGSIVLLFSDFAHADETTETLCSQLAAHGECRLFWITDPLEEQALPDGRFRAGFPNRARIVEGAHIRERWLASWREREARVERLARRIVAPVARLDTREPADEALHRLLPRQHLAA
jgi:uncharacterized protein (DUF58 family)